MTSREGVWTVTTVVPSMARAYPCVCGSEHEWRARARPVVSRNRRRRLWPEPAPGVSASQHASQFTEFPACGRQP